MAVTIMSDGSQINPDNYTQTLNYNGDGTVNYVQFVTGNGTYRQTMSYTSGKVTDISQWVKQ
jgi:hypothetical protein